CCKPLLDVRKLRVRTARNEHALLIAVEGRIPTEGGAQAIAGPIRVGHAWDVLETPEPRDKPVILGARATCGKTGKSVKKPFLLLAFLVLVGQSVEDGLVLYDGLMFCRRKFAGDDAHSADRSAVENAIAVLLKQFRPSLAGKNLC